MSGAERRPLLSTRRNGAIDMSSNGPKDKQIFQRSLVGMTQGARKRAARAACVGHRFKTQRLKLVWFRCWARDVRGRIATESDLDILKRYANARANRRVGQKLRPCPGCAQCQPCAHCGKPSTCIGLYDAYHETQKPEPACDECCAHGCEDGHCEPRADDEKQCNGSGVLPARKAKR